MAVFRGMDQSEMIAATRQTFRQVRSTQGTGKPVSEQQSQPILTPIRNYRRPILVSACGLAAIVAVGIGANSYVQSHSVTYYQVILNGTPVGEISSASKVEELLTAKSVELDAANTPVHLVLNEGQVAYQTERAYKKKTDDSATLARLEGMLQTHAVGVKLIVNGKEVGIVRDEKAANALLQKIKNKYVPASTVKKAGTEVQTLSVSTGSKRNAETAKPQRTVTSVSFAEKVEMVPTDIEASQISDANTLYGKLTKGEAIPRKYTVQAGDCIGCIAAKMDITEELIYVNNGLDQRR